MTSKLQRKRGQKKKKEKTFAEKFWREFEKLSMLIIESFYDDIPEKTVILTEKSKDGGYDGIILFPISSYNRSEIYKILVEAKLRNPSSKDLPLSDFAKTAIVSVNAVADRLYISTNLHFSPATKQKLKTFSNRTGIDIHLIDIKVIADWLTDHVHLTGKIDKILIDNICSLNSLVTIEKTETVFNSIQPENNNNIPPLIGRDRINNLNNALQKLIYAREDIIISGQFGCGKSIFIQNLIEGLRHTGIQLLSIDFSTNTTIRQIFIHLLSNIWNVRSEDIYALTKKGLETLFKPITDAPLDINTQFTIISMIHWDEKKFIENIDVLGYILIEYLEYILGPMLKRVRYTIILYNLAETSPIVFSFMLKFATKMKNCQISFIYELRDVIESDNITLLKDKFKDVYHIILKPWEQLDAMAFLALKFPHLDMKIINDIAETYGGNPFFLSREADLLSNNPLYDLMKKGAFNPAVLSNPKYVSSYFVNQFCSYLDNSSPEVRDIFVFFVLFEGQISVKILWLYFGQKKSEQLLNELGRVDFFLITEVDVKFKHAIFLECARNACDITHINYITPGKWIIENISSFFKDEFLQQKKIFEIAIVINDYTLIRKLWKRIVTHYILTADYENACKSVDYIFHDLFTTGNTGDFTPLDKIALLVMMLKTRISMNHWKDEDVNYIQKLLDAEISLYIEYMDLSDSNFIRLLKEKIYIEAKIMLANGKYKQIIELIEEYEKTLLFDTEKDRKMGLVLVMKTLGIKHCHGMSKAFSYLKSIRKEYTEAPEIQLSFFSYLASRYTVTNPKNALKCFMMSKKYATACTLEDRLHCDNNIAMMYLYLNQTGLSTTLAAKIKLDAFCYSIPVEEGRAANTLGGLAWIQGNVTEAENYFYEAYQIFDRIKHMTHIWPILINLASLYLELKNNVYSLHYAQSAVGVLLEYHASVIEKFSGTGTLKSKYYTGTLILINILYQLNPNLAEIDNLLNQINSECLIKDFNNYVKKGGLSELLDNSVYLLNGRLFLKV